MRILMSGSLYFEDFSLGEEIRSQGRTVQQSDIINFAGLTGDFNPLHVDSEFAKKSVFGSTIAHGMLGFSFAVGLIVQTGIINESILAFESVGNWQFKRPVYPGDTIYCLAKISAKEPRKLIKGPKGGSLSISLQLFNQKNKLCQTGLLHFLVKSKEV